jgi:integrase
MAGGIDKPGVGGIIVDWKTGKQKGIGWWDAQEHGQNLVTLGFPVNLHRFRHAAMTLWSIHDPKNVRGGKDLLGHASFATTEKHYIISQSRMAGRELPRIVDQSFGKSR